MDLQFYSRLLRPIIGQFLAGEEGRLKDRFLNLFS